MKFLLRASLALCVLLQFFYGCKRFDEIDKNDLKIADTVTVNKVGYHEVFEGTRIFIDVPEGFTYVKSILRFQKDTNIYIQALENPTLSFKDVKEPMLAQIDELNTKGLKSYYKKEFILQEFEACLLYGPDNLNPGCDEMVLFFGDDESSVLLSARFPSDSIRIAGEIRNALLTAYLDKDYTPDLTALMPYEINLTGTDFKFHSATSIVANYTVNGEGNPNDPTVDLFSIISMSAMNDHNTRIAYAQSMIPRYKANGIIIPKFDEQDILINNVPAYEISFKGAYNGKAMQCYQIVLGNNQQTLLFVGQVGVDKVELYEQIIQISQTLRLK